MQEFDMGKVNLVIRSREKDLGGFSVRRVLPFVTQRMVGPFIFFDHMGPAEFAAGTGMSVRPHPHIHLATVTYLFEGKIHHRDSLGSDQLIEPGAINWMTAGRGIVHSERTPEELKRTGGRLNGIQCWVALPDEAEESAPSFVHHPSASLPEFTLDGVHLKLLLGAAFGKQSAVAVHSDLFYLDVSMPKGTRLVLPGDGRECAVYLVNGAVDVGGVELEPCSMAIAEVGEDLLVEARQASRLMVLGGKPIGKRFIYWNFVSSSEASIEEAKSDWSRGPGALNSRFSRVPGDDQEFIPLPEEFGRPAPSD
jgi:redox-sensitive bicupin YhaK (pirin superfamily)